jgi:ABC-2 type transport system ATP-binding protein
LLHNPPVLILDEPTTGLDPNQIVEIRNLIKTISKEKTIIFSTHIMQEVQAICDRAIIIHLGQIRADSEVSALKSMMQTENIIFVEFAQAVDEGILKSLSGVNSLKKIATASYEIRTDAQIDVRASLSQTAGKQGWTLLGLRQEESSLENVFRELTQ